jgi:hypothetical protein
MSEHDDQRVYLGDSVYAALENGMIKLTTENGYGPSNTILLESEVYEALVRWVERLKRTVTVEPAKG